MSIASELSRIQQAKADIKESLEAKGAVIESSATLDDYPEIIDNLPSGGDDSVLKDLIERDITSIDIPNGTTTLGTYIFGNCHNLTSVTIPNTVTSIGGGAFGHCGIRTIQLPNSVTTIGEQAFMGSDLVYITIPSSVNNLSTYVFTECASLTNVTFENNLTLLPIGTFKSSSLTQYVIPNTVTEIGSSAFSACRSLTSITIPSSVTNIGSRSFELCSSLTSITLPSSITSIGTYCFQGCSGLTSITVEATTPPTLGNKALDNTNDCPIYVPCASVDTYKAANGWKGYASRIQCEGGSSDQPTYSNVNLCEGLGVSGGQPLDYEFDNLYASNDATITQGQVYAINADVDGYGGGTWWVEENWSSGQTTTLTSGGYINLVKVDPNTATVNGTSIDDWADRGVYFGFNIDTSVSTIEVELDKDNQTYRITGN